MKGTSFPSMSVNRMSTAAGAPEVTPEAGRRNRSTLELWTDTLCAHLRWKVAPESLPSEAW